MIDPVNVAIITHALQSMLAEDTRLTEAYVTRSEEPNENPAMTPWIGIYRLRTDYPARVLGMGQGYRRQLVDLVVQVQHADGTSGEQCEDRLEQVVANVVSAILSDPSLRGTVIDLPRLEVVYEYARALNNSLMQTANIFLTLEARVLAS